MNLHGCATSLPPLINLPKPNHIKIHYPNPITSVTPVTSITPVTPVTSITPGTPVTPVTPVTPGTPGTTGTTVTPVTLTPSKYMKIEIDLVNYFIIWFFILLPVLPPPS